MKNNKAQVKMFENVGVLVVFFFLLGMGAVFYSNYQSQSLAVEQKNLLELRSLQLAQQIQNIPELDCHYGSVRISNCIDSMKLEIFQNLINNNKDNKENYFDLFANSRISLKEIHPQEKAELLLYEEKPIGKFVSRVFKIPVILFNAKEQSDSSGQAIHCANQLGKCSLAILDVTYYETR